MIKSITSSLTCSDCGTGLDLEYKVTPNQPKEEPALGCPECLYTQDIEDLVAKIEAENAPNHVRVLALQPHTEISIGASQEHR